MKKLTKRILAILILMVSVQFINLTAQDQAGITVDNTGKVGINTTTPTTDLDVNGNVKMSGNETIGGNLKVNGNIDVTGDLNIKSDFNVVGNTTLDNIKLNTGKISDTNNKIRIEITATGEVIIKKPDGGNAIIVKADGNVDFLYDVSIQGRDIKDKNDKTRITMTEDGKFEIKDKNEFPTVTVDKKTYNTTSGLQDQNNIKLNGVIEDQYGELLPPGTIVAYYGTITSIPAGWLLCDGTDFPSGTQYERLKQLLGNPVKVPDLRGVFLRGIDADKTGLKRNYDADSATREQIPGTYQDDTFQGHFHDDYGWMLGSGVDGDRTNWFTAGTHSVNTGKVTNPITDGVNGNVRTGKETRPKNVYVYYIIKY